METQTKTPNPFLAIWIKPRGTLRHILDTNPQQHVLLLAALSGIYRAFDNASKQSLGDSFAFLPLLAVCILAGGLIGIASVYITAELFRWAGSALDGKATSEEMRAALAWSALPDCVLLVIYIPILVIYGHKWFTSSPEWMSAELALAIIIVLAPIGIVMLAWRAFLFVKCLAEAHRFSAWRGLATGILGTAVVVVPLLVFFALF
ncbi:MAG: Yip1 family protein [Chloroflexota bacterium]